MTGHDRRATEGIRQRAILDMAFGALGRYKLRTSLSVLGVVLGVAAVISMMSVGEGARTEALDQIASLGLNNLVVRNPTGRSTSGLTLADADLLQALVPFAVAASPLVERVTRVEHRGAAVVTNILGIQPGYQTILALTVDRGRFLSVVDDRSTTCVCVLGPVLSRQLFGSTSPVGDVVRLQGSYCQVVGVLSAQTGNSRAFSTLAWRDLNRSVLMPVGALTRQSARTAPGQPVDEVWIRTSPDAGTEELATILAHTLSRLHPDLPGFSIIVPRALLAQRYRTQQTFGVVLASVAAITLVVGGIGIMNIMLTSVTERTKEIGVRRAVGATRRDIAAQFLAESLLMTIGGGLLGIVLGTAVSFGITAYAGWSTRVSPMAVALGFGVAGAVGLVFGLYPALKAARLEPVDALHHE